MQALQIVARGVAEFIETAEPELEPGHILVRPRWVSLCGSDVWMLDYGPEDAYPYPPGTSGHEVIAEIVALNSTSLPHRVGDLTLTIAPDHRAMAEYYLAPVRNVLPLPAGKSPQQLLMAQQLGTVIYACKQLPSVIGKTVAVVGQGSAGLWFNVMLQRLGAGRVVAIDKLAHRLALSEAYGATHAVNGATENPVDWMRKVNDGELADIVIEAAGTEAAINLSIDLAKSDTGFILQFGLPRQPRSLNYAEMFFKCLQNKSIVHAATEVGHTSTRMALNMIASGEVEVDLLLTHRLPFNKVHQAYELQRTGSNDAIKTVVEMPSA